MLAWLMSVYIITIEFKKDQKDKKEAAAKRRKTESSGEDSVAPDSKKQKTDENQDGDTGNSESNYVQSNNDEQDAEENE